MAFTALASASATATFCFCSASTVLSLFSAANRNCSCVTLSLMAAMYVGEKENPVAVERPYDLENNENGKNNPCPLDELLYIHRFHVPPYLRFLTDLDLAHYRTSWPSIAVP